MKSSKQANGRIVPCFFIAFTPILLISVFGAEGKHPPQQPEKNTIFATYCKAAPEVKAE
jgi:hypothetical protein